MNITIGADPEFFVFDPTTSTYIPSIGLFGGTKHHPKPIFDKTGNEIGQIQEDNVMGEFCVPPATNPDDFVKSIKTILRRVSTTLPNGYTIAKEAGAYFDPNMLDHPQARMVGCDPDFDAWSVKQNPTPKVAGGNLRTCGGHVHVGMPEIIGKNDRERAFDRIEFVKYLDLFLGVPSVLLDKDTLRMQFYGKAGAHRPKPYGVEYRTLSNFWIFKDNLIRWIFTNAATAYYEFRRGFNISGLENSIQMCINLKDKQLAKSLTGALSIPMPV